MVSKWRRERGKIGFWDIVLSLCGYEKREDIKKHALGEEDLKEKMIEIPLELSENKLCLG